MQFQVPQFIETEDRIIGPLTLIQFFYLAIAGGISFALFFILSIPIWILVTFFISIIALAFAFIKINGRPLSVAAVAALGFYWRPRLYLWQRKKEVEKIPTIKLQDSKLTQIKSRLDNLLDQLKTTTRPIPKREKPINTPAITEQVKDSKERFEMMRKLTGEKEIARRIDYK